VINHDLGETPDGRRIEGRGNIIHRIEETWESLTDLKPHDLDHFDQTLEVYRNAEAYHNLLRLATGLDSLVVGKEEILHEIKEAISGAKLAKVSGRVLNKLFDTCIRVATRIRDSTGIGKDVMSIGEIAVKMAEENAGIDDKKHLLLIGTGETAALVAKSLNSKDYAFDVTSRLIERSNGFSKILSGNPISFEDVLTGFDKFDIIFVATTSDYFLITADKIKRVMEKKKTGTMILDVSDPRTVEEQISSFPKVKLMFRDQIAEIYEERMTAGKKKIPNVEKMIAKEVPIIEASMKRLAPESLVKAVSETVDSLRLKELGKAIRMLGETDKEKIKIIDELTKAIAKNVISVPASNSKKESE